MNYKNPHRYKNGDNLHTEYYPVESWIAESLWFLWTKINIWKELIYNEKEYK